MLIIKIIGLILWGIILILHWAFIQNQDLLEELLEEENVEIEINFDPIYFFTWLVGTIFMITSIFEF